MRRGVLAVVVLTACGTGPRPGSATVRETPAATADAPPDGAPDDEPGELLSDVQHLLGEALTAHGAGQRTTAERKWTAAHLLWATKLEPAVRAKDPLRALQLGYQFGQLGDDLRRGAGRATAASKELDRALEDVRAWVVSPVDAESTNPGG